MISFIPVNDASVATLRWDVEFSRNVAQLRFLRNNLLSGGQKSLLQTMLEL